MTIKALEEYITTGLVLDTTHLIKVEYDKKEYSFTQTKSNDIMHIDYIAQGPEAKNAWSTFILDDSKGFTRAGVERLTTVSEHTSGLFLFHSLKRGLVYWELALHLMHKNIFLPTLKMQLKAL